METRAVTSRTGLGRHGQQDHLLGADPPGSFAQVARDARGIDVHVEVGALGTLGRAEQVVAAGTALAARRAHGSVGLGGAGASFHSPRVPHFPGSGRAGHGAFGTIRSLHISRWAGSGLQSGQL